jgi:hypothetical protein
MTIARAFILLALTATAAFAQNRIPIAIEARADDAVGKSFVYDLKEAIGHSALYRYVSSDSQTQGISLSIVTISLQQTDDNNNECAVSVVLRLNVADAPIPYYLDHWVVLVVRQGQKLWLAACLRTSMRTWTLNERP